MTEPEAGAPDPAPSASSPPPERPPRGTEKSREADDAEPRVVDWCGALD